MPPLLSTDEHRDFNALTVSLGGFTLMVMCVCSAILLINIGFICVAWRRLLLLVCAICGLLLDYLRFLARANPLADRGFAVALAAKRGRRFPRRGCAGYLPPDFRGHAKPRHRYIA
jgi:hypothetical protein